MSDKDIPIPPANLDPKTSTVPANTEAEKRLRDDKTPRDTPSLTELEDKAKDPSEPAASATADTRTIAEAKREASPAPPPPAPLAITGDQLAAALTQLAQKASATGLPSAAQQSPPGKMVTVVSMGQRFYRPGEEVNRWGIKFVVQGDGRTLEAEVDERLVKSGMEGGRYYPKGGDLGDAALIYWQTQYRETFGIPAPPNVNSTISLLQASIEAEIKRQEENAAKQSGEGKR